MKVFYFRQKKALDEKYFLFHAKSSLCYQNILVFVLCSVFNAVSSPLAGSSDFYSARKKRQKSGAEYLEKI